MERLGPQGRVGASSPGQQPLGQQLAAEEMVGSGAGGAPEPVGSDGLQFEPVEQW